MSRAKLAPAAILIAFALLAALRLNGFCLLEPDSPGYLFGAKSLASFEGYRDIDRPGRPLHTFRPPGLSASLVPLAWAAPYSVAAAKLFVLATALVGLALAATLASRQGPGWGALAATLLIASSPYALLHATEIVTEFPYLAVSLAAILLVTRSPAAPSRGQVATLAALLTGLPFLRTIGVALVVAVALWCLADRGRRGWLPAPGAAAAATALWMLRNQAAGGPTYFGAIVVELRGSGPGPFAWKALAGAGDYAGRFLDVLLPGLWPGRPMYERMTIGGAADLGGLHGAAWGISLAAIALAAWGLRARWRRDGSLIAIYAALFLAMLAVYPPRHERLTWPLIPLAWALVPAGLDAFARVLPSRRNVLRTTAGVALAAGAGLVAWQTAASAAMVRDNQAWARGGARFYSERVPPLYFADWRAAGSWLRDNALAGSRVLTRHSDAGFTSGLPQESARFEELPPAAWRARIAALRARYLVVPTSLFGKFFPLELLDSDPAYAYTMLWRGGDVAVIGIGPNLAGRVVPPAPPPAETIAACESAARAHPDRVDLATRCAELIAAAGRRDEAIAALGAIVARGGADVRIQVTLGQMLLAARRDDEAAAAFRAAASLPEADLLRQTIERGRRTAEELAAAKSVDKLVRARTAMARAKDAMDGLRWGDAAASLEEALIFAPYDLPVVVTAANLATRVGAYDGAIAFYDQAAAGGDAGAAAKGGALRAALAVEATVDTADPRAIVGAAAFWAGEGTPGRALDLLQRASRRHPTDPEIASRLAQVRRFYGLD